MGETPAVTTRVTRTITDNNSSSGFYKAEHTTGYNITTNGVRLVTGESTDKFSAPPIFYEPNVVTNGSYGTQRIYRTPSLTDPVWTQVDQTTNGVPAHVDSAVIGGIQKTADGTTIAVDYVPKTGTENP